MSMMGNFGPSSAEDNGDDMKEQRRKNISAVLQRLSDKQSSGYESEREGDLGIQTTPTDPAITVLTRSQDVDDATRTGDVTTETSMHTYSEYEEVQIRQSRMKQESWVKYQQEIVQQSMTSSTSTSHSVCYPIPKPLPSKSAYIHVTGSEGEFVEIPGRGYEKSSTQSKEGLIPATWSHGSEGSHSSQDSHSILREPVIVPRHQSPFYRPHLWKSPTQGTTYKDLCLQEITDTKHFQYELGVEEMHVPVDQSTESTPSVSKREGSPRKVELFPPAECMSVPPHSREPPAATSESDRSKAATQTAANLDGSSQYPRSFKKYLQERYISSLKDLELRETVEDEPSSETGHHLSAQEERSIIDMARKDPSFSSTDSEGRGDVILHSEVFIRVRDVEDDRREEEEGIESKDDVFESDYMEPPQRSFHHQQPPAKVRLGSTEEPLDLTSKQPPPLPCNIGGHEHSLEDLRSTGHFPLQLSPSMYHHSPPMFYSPQHEIISPRSPLWAVPEGRVFNFNLPSPFEPRCHSDPEFFSPGFSPDSPGMHFTFPPRPPFQNPGPEHSRLPKSPRLVFPTNPSRFSASPGKTLPKLFCSPPPMSDFIRPSTGEGSSAQGSELTYICPVCGQVFPSYDNLAKHMAKHLPTETVKTVDNNKIHYCKVCNRAFSRSDMLTRHMRLHTGLKPYECRVCGQVFSRSDHLNTHQRTHTGEKPYRCPQCPYAACRRDMITRHMRIHLKRSSKRSKYLAVPEGESGDVRKSSVSSTDTTDSQEHSGRTCSVSSVDSMDSEGGSKKGPMTSGESIDLEVPPGGSRLWSSTSAESTDFEELAPQARQSGSSAFYTDSPGPFLEPTFTYRKSRNWSTASFESIDSEGSGSRRDSVADDFGDADPKLPSESKSSRDTPIIDDSLRKFTISSDDIQK